MNYTELHIFNIVIRLIKCLNTGSDFSRTGFHASRSVFINPMPKYSTGFPNILLVTNLAFYDVYNIGNFTFDVCTFGA